MRTDVNLNEYLWKEGVFLIARSYANGVILILAVDYPIIMGFEPLVNQRLLPPTFPRYIKIKSRQEAVDYFESLVERLKTVCNVINCHSFHHALVNVLN